MVDSSSTSSSKGLLRLLSKIALFAALIAGLDFGVGKGLAYLYGQCREGDFGGRINLALEQRHDIVVFGSSRALHHYIPERIEANTGLSCFNAGMDAQTLLYHFGLQQMILDKYQPKLLVLDLNTEDIRYDPDRRAYGKLSRLLPFHKHPEVHKLLLKRSPYEKWKLLSQIYPYNSQVLSILRYRLKANAEGSQARKGYVPLHGSDMPALLARWDPQPIPALVDREYIGYLHRFIQKARNQGIPIVVCSSPLWEIDNGNYCEQHKALVRRYKEVLASLDVPLIEITQKNYPLFRDPALFKDLTHLNDAGAQHFSKLFAQRLQALSSTRNPS